jgi:hypothetical protein
MRKNREDQVTVRANFLEVRVLYITISLFINNEIDVV